MKLFLKYSIYAVLSVILLVFLFISVDGLSFVIYKYFNKISKYLYTDYYLNIIAYIGRLVAFIFILVVLGRLFLLNFENFFEEGTYDQITTINSGLLTFIVGFFTIWQLYSFFFKFLPVYNKDYGFVKNYSYSTAVDEWNVKDIIDNENRIQIDDLRIFDVNKMKLKEMGKIPDGARLEILYLPNSMLLLDYNVIKVGDGVPDE